MEDGFNLLRQERERSGGISCENLSRLLYGSEEILEKRRKLRNLVEKHPILGKHKSCFLNHHETYTFSLEKVHHFLDLLQRENLTDRQEILWVYQAIGEVLPLDVHLSMFIPTIESQCSPTQREKWLPLAEQFRIIGAYAQTELGHGSNIRGIETLATFDPHHQEFIIHSPTLTSRKWWPGGLGKTATHAAVYARLILQGKDYGVHGFLVPLRDSKTHQSLPGVYIGDIGPKLGYKGNDNGYCYFHHVRIPLENMLMRFAQVSSDGKYHAPRNMKLGYYTMVRVRSYLVSSSARILAMAATITTRYSIVRRQGFPSNNNKNQGFPSNNNKNQGFPSNNNKNQEYQIIEYQSQQASLFPIIATVFALHFTGTLMIETYEQITKYHISSLSNVNPKNDTNDTNPKNDGNRGLSNFNIKNPTMENEKLAELHATASALKGVGCNMAVDAIEKCRRLCGGQGYSMLSNLPQLLMDFSPSTTFEGTLEVLSQQTTRYLLKQLENPTNLTSNTSHLGSFQQLLNWKCEMNTRDDFLDPKQLIVAFQARAVYKLHLVQQGIQHFMTTNPQATYSHAWQKHLVDCIHATLAHAHLIMVTSFYASLNKVINDSNLQSCLENLATLFALHLMEQHQGDFFLSKSQSKQLQFTWIHLLDAIRPHVLVLMDAWDFTDFQLNSQIGKYDGNIYTALTTKVNEEPLNQQDVAHGIIQFLQPHLHSKL